MLRKNFLNDPFSRSCHLAIDIITSLKNCFFQFDLMLSEDGSGRGAALVAAVAVRIGMSAAA